MLNHWNKLMGSLEVKNILTSWETSSF